VSKTIVVGGGVTGLVIAGHLALTGEEVTIVDDGRVGSGTAASGFLLRPSWAGGADFGKVMEVLERLCIVDVLDFTIYPVGKVVKVHRAVPKMPGVLGVEWLTGKVAQVEKRKEGFWVDIRTGTRPWSLVADRVVLATGSWANELLPKELQLKLETKVGCSFTWRSPVGRNFIKPWAPFKQVVAYNIPGQECCWAGDGTAILERNWSQDNIEVCAERVSGELNKKRQLGTITIGRRPVVKGSKWYCEEVSKNLWVATGGGKIGTTAAALSALKIAESLK